MRTSTTNQANQVRGGVCAAAQEGKREEEPSPNHFFDQRKAHKMDRLLQSQLRSLLNNEAGTAAGALTGNREGKGGNRSAADAITLKKKKMTTKKKKKALATKQNRKEGRKSTQKVSEVPELFRNTLDRQEDEELEYRKNVALLTGKGASLALEIELKRAARRESRRRRKKNKDFRDFTFADEGSRGIGKAKKKKLTKAQRRKASSTSLRGKYNIFD